MGETSAIEWTDATWNPWQGCTRVSPACANCYMFPGMRRFGKDPTVVVRSSPATFGLPLKKDRDGNFKIGPGKMVFTCSWSDWFHEDADPWRPEAWEVIRRRPDLIFQIVTKRPERIIDHLPADWGDGWPNVWLIATAETQQWLTARMTYLVKVPCAARGLSIEPLLGPMNLNSWGDRIDWVIVGGESGAAESRTMQPDWVRGLRDQCLDWRIPFFFKQWGDTVRGDQIPEAVVCESDDAIDETRFYRLGKTKSGRMLDGREWSEFPKGVVLNGS